MRVQTYSDSGTIKATLRHSMRSFFKTNNKDIDTERTKENYYILERKDPFAFFQKRLSEVYCYNRADVKRLCEWIITIPKDTPADQERKFFQESYNYLLEKFCHGDNRNVLTAVIHKDEKRINGAPIAHMHFFFMPIVHDPKHKEREKICKKEAMPKDCFTSIHPELQKYLEKKGVKGTVYSGITKQQLRNYKVDEIKSGKRDLLEKHQYQENHQNQEEEINFFTGKPIQISHENTSFFNQHQEEEHEQNF